MEEEPALIIDQFHDRPGLVPRACQVSLSDQWSSSLVGYS